MLETTTIRKGKKFETGLIWKFDEIKLPNNYELARRRMECLKRKMASDPVLSERLNQQIRDHVTKGYARKLSPEELRQQHPIIWYLPIFPVVNPNKPGKIRLVFDAAAKTNGVSLNSSLLKGPDMLVPLLSVLYKFRERNIAISGDIREMYHQVLVRPSDQQVQRFLWPGDGQDPDVYVMQVMTFGASCSPASAQFVKNKNAMEFVEQYPKAAKAIVENHYVDDYLDSFESEEQAIQSARDVKFVHEQGGYEIRNWISNSKKVMETLNQSSVEKIKNLNISWYQLTKNPKNIEILKNGQPPTKREVLRILMMVFDPLGLLSNFLVFVKVLLQDVWRADLDWYDRLNGELLEKWSSWVNLLPTIETVRIPRCYQLPYNPEVQLHIFVDASETAYAAVCYFRVEHSGGVVVSLVSAKSRVAPLKILSIPRLELEACLLGSRLAKNVCDGHSLQISSCQFWSDSRTALGWIKSDHRRYKQFVAFRAAEIGELTDSKQWRFVPTAQNVADEATKWSKTPDLSQNSRWIRGPNFLYLPEDEWPVDTSKNSTTQEEIRTVLHHRKSKLPKKALVVQLNPIDYSSWSRLRWRFANIFRFVYNLKAAREHRPRRSGPIASEDYLDAENHLYRQAQQESYTSEIDCLDSNKILPDCDKKQIEKSSRVYHLVPYLDEKNVLRSRGRIDASKDIGINTKRPVILPKTNHITRLIIRFYHEKYLHQNTETVINELRQNFVIPHLRAVVKSEIKACQVCKNRKAVPVPPLMGDLPPARLMAFTRPFTYIGIDYFGPMYVTVGRSTVKRWGALITCLTTRAVHIEISYTLSTDSCILVLRSMMARRGIPREIYSDNGTNFRGASVELQRAVEKIDKEKLAREFNSDITNWIFIPPASPHMGGSWERLVRSVKTALSMITLPRNPSDELLRCQLIEVENIINSRPLVYVPMDPETEEMITPNHFLVGSSNGIKPQGQMNDEGKILQKNYLRSQQFADAFWRRWVTEYLPHLTHRGKWYESAKPIQIDDIVVIMDSDGPRNSWPKGRVIDTVKSADGQVRRVTVKTATGVYERPTVKIAVLDVRNNLGKSNAVDVPGGSVVTNDYYPK